MAADITAFDRAVNNLKFRRGVVAFCLASAYEAGGYTLSNAGIIKDTSLQMEGIVYGPDNSQREFTVGFTFALNFTLMQTGPAELQNLPAVVKPTGNGLYVAVTDGPPPAIDGTTVTDFTDAIDQSDKIEFINAVMAASPTIQFNTEESGVVVTAKGTISVEDLEKLYVSPIVVA